MRLANIPSKFKSSLARRFCNLFNYYPSSYPYVSGDSFRALCEATYEKRKKPRIEELKKARLIFVETDLWEKFCSLVLDKLVHPVIIICHNSDYNLTVRSISLIENKKIFHLFSQNALISHPKLTAIPIGLENMRYFYNGVIADFRKLATRPGARDFKILVNFSVGNNKEEREKAYSIVAKHPLALIMPRTNPSQYRRVVRKVAFVLSPPGNGFDCHRTWEALYLGAIPLVKKSIFFDHFPDLPVIQLSAWEEILDWDEPYLKKLYQEIVEKIASCPYLWMEYWIKLIMKKRAELD